jgi:hypothetical protein
VDTVEVGRGLEYYGEGFSSLFLNGVLYLASDMISHIVPEKLWALDLEEQTIKEHDVQIPNRRDQPVLKFCDVVGYKNNLFMVIGNYGEFQDILKIDVQSLSIAHFSSLLVPKNQYPFCTNFRAESSDGCHIFFSSLCFHDGHLYALAYNVKDQFWSGRITPPVTYAGRNLEYVDIVSFQPGLCPFLWEV